MNVGDVVQVKWAVLAPLLFAVGCNLMVGIVEVHDRELAGGEGGAGGAGGSAPADDTAAGTDSASSTGGGAGSGGSGGGSGGTGGGGGAVCGNDVIEDDEMCDDGPGNGETCIQDCRCGNKKKFKDTDTATFVANGKCYILVKKDSSWHQAWKGCNSASMVLATIADDSSLTSINNFIDPPAPVWTAGINLVDGEMNSFEWFNGGQLGASTPWDTGNFDPGYKDDVSCVKIDGSNNRRLVNMPCVIGNYFLCEKALAQ